MGTPFSSPIWQLGTFTFMLHSAPQSIDARGNTASIGQAIALTLKMSPAGGSSQRGEAADTGIDAYKCRVVAVDGDYNNTILPTGISPKDVGEGTFRGRECQAIVKSIAQSSLAPLLEKVLGSSLDIELDYRIRRGSGV
jgi:hypothetical protein